MADLNRPRIKSENLVWDVSTLTWVAMTQPAGGGGGGTADIQYVEDAVAVANPTGTAIALRRRDTLNAAEVSADGDIIIANASNKGELYVKHTDLLGVAAQQGTPFSGNAWYIRDIGPITVAVISNDTSLDTVGDELQALNPVKGGNNFHLEITGTYTDATVEFWMDYGGKRSPIGGVRLDTGLLESSSFLGNNNTRRWKFHVPGLSDATDTTFLIKLTTISSGALTVNAAAHAGTFDYASNPTTVGLTAGSCVIGSVKQSGPNAVENNAWWTKMGTTGFQSTGVCSGTFLAPSNTVSGSIVAVTAGNVIIAELWGSSHSGANIEFKLVGQNGDEIPAMGFRLDTQASGTSTGVIPDNTSQFWMFYLPGAQGNGSFLARATAITSGAININVDATGSPAWPFLPSSGGGGGGTGDGAILDGVTPSIKATVTGSNALKVDGSAVTQPVSGTFWQATQPVSGTFWQATQPISGTVTVQDGGNVISVDDAAGSLTVDGTVTSNQGTANTVANGWPVKVTDGTNTMPTMDTVGRAGFHKITDGTNTAAVNGASQLQVNAGQGAAALASGGWPTISGAFIGGTTTWTSATALDSAVTVTTSETYTTLMVTIVKTGVISAGAVSFEASNDGGTTWFPISGYSVDLNDVTSSFTLSTLTKAMYAFNISTIDTWRVRLNPAITGAGSLAVKYSFSNSLAVVKSQIAGTVTLNDVAGIDVNIVTGGVDQGLPAVTSNAWPTKITDGTNVATVKGASAAAIATDKALVVAVSPNNSVAVTQATGTNLHMVVDSGTVSTITNVVHVDDNSGSLTVDAPVGTPVFVRLSDGAAAISALPITDNAGSLTVDGTITANQGGAPWSQNVTQFGGTNLSTGTGAGGAGIPRVTVSNDSAIKLWDGTNTTTVKAASTAAAFTDVAATVDIRPGGVLPASAASADGLTNPTITQIGADSMLFNGTTWDRARGNWRTTTGDTGTKTTTFNGATQTNFDSLGAYIVIQLGTVSGTTPTLACQMQFSFDAGTTFLNFGPALANLTTTSQTGVIGIYPANFSQTAGATPANLTNGGTVSMFLNMPLPRTWRIVYTLGGTTPSFAITNVHVLYQK